MSKLFHFLGIPWRVFFKFDMEKPENVNYGGCGARTHDLENPSSVDDAICYGICEVLVRLTTCKR